MPTLLLAALLVASDENPAAKAFQIRVVDSQSGRGVPLVQLETVNNVLFYTDSNGVAAIDDPSLFGERTFFHVRSHGYEFPKDGFGIRGKAIDVVPGGSATLKIDRKNIAERLYRVTGGGIYRDSVLLGLPAPTRKPLLNARVFGSDSVLSAVYKGRIHWFWGDTNQVAYPLGNFHVPGATSALPGRGGLDPSVGVNLEYFVDPKTGFARETARFSGEGPIWLFGMAVLPDRERGERLFATYYKVKPPMTTYERGFAEFDGRTNAWRKLGTFPVDGGIQPSGHTFIAKNRKGTEYVYFATALPCIRVPATPEAFADYSAYEAFTCIESGSTLANPKIERDDKRRPVYRWRKNAPQIGPAEMETLTRAGVLKRDEAWYGLHDVETDRLVTPHAGSVAWNEYRKRWVMIFSEHFGTSLLGEIWYAEADAPEGPWVYARKIVTHERYSFYNPRHHPFFDQEGGRRIYFEGTYTHSFSGNTVQTPRYDYNQIMYRLDLGDARLRLPIVTRQPGSKEVVRPNPIRAVLKTD